MMANLTCDLLNHERIKTTTPKAKELRRYAERMITLGKDGSLSARRRAMGFLRNKAVVTKIFNELAKRYEERKGGYTRILKLGVRPGDCAPVSLIELVDSVSEVEAEPDKKPAAKKAAPKKPAAKKADAEGSEKKATKAKKAAPKKPAAKKAEDAEGSEKKPAVKKAAPKKEEKE